MTPEQPQKHRRLSFNKRSSRKLDEDSDNEVAPKSEVAAAAAAAAAEQEGKPKMPTAASSSQPHHTSPSKSTSMIVTPPPDRSRSTAGGELRSAKKTLQEREQQLNRVSLRSREMSDSAVNFASAAQGFLELSQKKK